ncbi:MAG: hypothetical protein M3P23_02560 [Actinomycetota bacterium]|nr:hypothetical protein [Actinomycetota bacterium]
MGKGWTPVVAAALLCVGIAGDARAPHASTASAIPPKTTGHHVSLNAHDDPASDHRIVYTAGLISDPLPSPRARVSVTADQAIAAINTGRYVAMETRRPRATLRLVTTGFAPHVNGPSPMWLLTWTGVQQPIHGKYTATPQPIQHCTAVEVEAVDANHPDRVYGIWVIC